MLLWTMSLLHRAIPWHVAPYSTVLYLFSRPFPLRLWPAGAGGRTAGQYARPHPRSACGVWHTADRHLPQRHRKWWEHYTVRPMRADDLPRKLITDDEPCDVLLLEGWKNLPPCPTTFFVEQGGFRIAYHGFFSHLPIWRRAYGQSHPHTSSWNAQVQQIFAWYDLTRDICNSSIIRYNSAHNFSKSFQTIQAKHPYSFAWKFSKYRILSHVLIGRRRKHYQQKYQKIKQDLSEVSHIEYRVFGVPLAKAVKFSTIYFYYLFGLIPAMMITKSSHSSKLILFGLQIFKKKKR